MFSLYRCHAFIMFVVFRLDFWEDLCVISRRTYALIISREIPPYFSEVCAVSLRGSMIYCKSSKKSSEK